MSENENEQTKKDGILKTSGRGFCKCCKAVGAFFQKPFFRIRLVQIYLLSFVTTYIVEGLSHYRSLPQFMHIVNHPLIFLTNMLIVSLLYAPPILFRKRGFFYLLSFVIWLTIGVTDFIVLHNRVTPFNANDFKMIRDAWNVVVHYFTPVQMIGLAVAVFLALAGVVYAAIKFPKSNSPVHLKSSIPMAIGVIVAGVFLTLGSVRIGIMERTFPNIADAYQDYGLPYCFACSIVDTGIKKPSGYSQNTVNNVIASLVDPTPSLSKDDSEKPNIIFIQLESFFDPKRIEGITFSEDPIPNFTKLYQNYSSGLLTVPSISAGTANTEFEVLTGMNMVDFGTGEYPYRTILQESTCESMAYNMKALGYSCHALHNNTATFYGRNVVFSHLGFDDFDAIETMPNVEMNALNWAKDKILYTEILAALNSTPGRDYIFAVSVQGHGKYPDEDILSDSIKLANVNDAYDDSTIYGLQYYTTQLHEMDEFIGTLVSYFSRSSEKNVLVLYGDHLPGFDFSESDLNEGNLLQTNYIVWANFPMEKISKDLCSYQLSSYVQGRLGFSEGIIARLHESVLFDSAKYDEQDYLEELKLLSYDMLYGSQFCWNGKNPYDKTDLTFGFYKRDITSLHPIYDSSEETWYLTVYGQDFTPYSYIYINGERQKHTIYVSSRELFLPEANLKDGDTIEIGIFNDGNQYYRSAPYTFTLSKYQ